MNTALNTADPRPARPEDLPAALALLNAARLPAEGVAEHFSHFLLIWDAHGLAGMVGQEPHGDAALLRSLAVRPDARGLGLGQALTQSLLARARSRGIQRVFLLTETASGFFPRFGFHAIPRESVDEAVRNSVEFRSACPQSAVCMRLHLASHSDGA